jgi:PhnB protein
MARGTLCGLSRGNATRESHGQELSLRVRFVAEGKQQKQRRKPNSMSTTKGSRVVEPYLFFNGNCEQAVEFYRRALGAEVQMTMRYKDSPEPPPPGRVPAGFENKIMHTSLRIGQTRVMASDGCSTEKPNFGSFSLSLSVPNEAEADRVFGALAEGGQVRMPLAKTFWSPRFGMVQDRFGVGWMISVEPATSS